MKRLSALGRSLDAADHAALDPPGPGGIAELAVAAHLLGLAQGPGDGRILGQSGDPGQQDLVAGEAEDVADAVLLAPGHGLVPGVVAVDADQDLHARPAGTDGAHHVTQD